MPQAKLTGAIGNGDGSKNEAVVLAFSQSLKLRRNLMRRLSMLLGDAALMAIAPSATESPTFRAPLGPDREPPAPALNRKQRRVEKAEARRAKRKGLV